MKLTHTAFLDFEPASEVLAELSVSVNLLLVLLMIFLPQQHLRHLFTPEFYSVLSEAWHDFVATGFLRVIQSLNEVCIITTFWQRPAKLALFKTSQEFRYGGRVEFKARIDAAI